jgi:hypothetical protein
MALYLQDFDKTLSEISSARDISLDEQLVYAVLTEPQVIISAASPFKNLFGWEVLRKYSLFITSGVVKFPLDKKHQGYVDHYIQSRIQKISTGSDTARMNPEVVGYTSRVAESIMGLISQPNFAAPRPRDCDFEFRKLVLDDTRAEEPGTINGLLYSKRLGWGKDEFLDFVAETASNEQKLFQRFHVIDHAPSSFIIDGVLRERLYRRLDELFFLANARAASASNSESITLFVHTLAARFRAFAKGYALQGASLHNVLMSLSPASLMAVRESSELAHFLRALSKWLSTASEHLLTEWAHKRAVRDCVSSHVQRVLTSVICVTASELLGWLMTAALQLPFGIPSKMASFLLGLFPQLAVKIKQTEARKLYDFTCSHPKMIKTEQSLALDGYSAVAS